MTSIDKHLLKEKVAVSGMTETAFIALLSVVICLGWASLFFTYM